jgi:long-chain acyl-CoA synthetase
MAVSIVDAFEQVARRQPDAPALSWRNTKWSYEELRRGSSAVAAALEKRAVPRGARIALLLRNSPQYVALYYGVLAAGCVAVPLNAQERWVVLARQIEHCGATVLIGDPAHPEWQALCAAIERNGVQVIAVELTDGAAALAMFEERLAPPAQTLALLAGVSENDVAAVIYTSGTTGRPKGVMLSHRNLLSNASSIIEYLQLSSADRGLCVLPFHFSYGNSVLHTHLLSGGYLALEDNFAFPQATLQRIQDEAITGFSGVPSTFALLLGRCRLSDFNLSKLRYITQAGGAMARPLIERLREQTPDVQIFIMYGQTEATARLTYLPPAKLEAKLGSVGVPIPGVRIELRDSQSHQVAAGEVGEICAHGPNIMVGYWNDAAATADVVRDGWLRTGDLARMDEDGYIYIEGRASDMIKVGAFRVSPQEIEEVLLALDGVEEVGVTGIPDETLGQSIKAVVVPKPGVQLEMLSVKAHCRQNLAAYKVPKIIEFAATLPRTSSGKIQRFKLGQEIRT